MLNIQKNFEIADIQDMTEDEGASLVFTLKGEASYNGKPIHTVTDDHHRNHVEIIVYYDELDGVPDWYVCDMQFYQIGETTYLTDELPQEVRDWFWDIEDLIKQAAQ